MSNETKVFKGTPGKWEVGKTATQNKTSIWVGGSRIAIIDEFPHIGSTANAHLIAAAPELLEACLKLQEFISDVVPSCAGGDDQLYYVRHLAEKAIDKALNL